MKAVWNGTVLAESDDTIVVEGNHYFPPDSVDFTHLERSWMRSLCFWKGVAGYYTIEAGGRRNNDAAWTYRHPPRGFARSGTTSPSGTASRWGSRATPLIAVVLLASTDPPGGPGRQTAARAR